MSEWNEFRLGDLCTFLSRGITPQYVDDGIPVINQKCIRNNKVDLSLCKYTSTTQKIKKEKYVQYGDILINSTGTGTLGRVAIFKHHAAKISADGHVTILHTTQDVNSVYLGYYLHSVEPLIENLGRGTTNQLELSPSDLKRIKIVLPDLHTQTRIADVLSTYDDWIEINNRRIALLEKATQELYKEWFVRFRFPGHETIKVDESRLGKIPSSFNIIKMNEAFDYYIGGGWGNDEYSSVFSEKAYVIRGTDFPSVQKGDLSSCPLRYHKESNYSARELKENDIIIEVSGGTAEQPVGRTLLVTKDVIDRLGGKVICASFCKQIRLNTEVVTPYYFYYWMQFLYDTRIIDRFQLQSTGIINFKFEYFLRKGDIMLPPRDLMDRFDEKVKVLYDEISMLAQQNENLAKQRDLLLPRLMSGKLEV